MTLQEQIREAWARHSEKPMSENDLALGTSLTTGVLVGAGFPYAAVFVLLLGQDRLGEDHPEMVELRRKLGLPQ